MSVFLVTGWDFSKSYKGWPIDPVVFRTEKSAKEKVTNMLKENDKYSLFIFEHEVFE